MRRLGAVLALAACASTQTAAKKPARIDDELVAMAPAGGDALGELDLVRVRAWTPAEKIMRLLPTEVRDELTEQVGFDLIRDVDRVIIWWRRSEGQNEHVIIARGRFDEARVRATAQRHGGQASEHRGVTILTMGDVSSALVRADLFVLGTRVSVIHTIDVMRGVGAALAPEEPVVVLRAQQPPGAALQIVGINTENPPKPPGLRSLAVRVDLEGGLDLTATLEHADAAAATANEQQLRDQTEQIRQQLATIGAAEYLDGLIVAAQGTRVVATFRLTGTQCEHLAELAARFVPFWLLERKRGQQQ